MAINENEVANATFPICEEDLKPLTESLQVVISTCGHVFHDLCLQLWLEFCDAKLKNTTCPLCRRTCSQENIIRLYYQSNKTQEDESKKLRDNLLQHQEQKLKEMSEQLRQCKEELVKAKEESSKFEQDCLGYRKKLVAVKSMLDDNLDEEIPQDPKSRVTHIINEPPSKKPIDPSAGRKFFARLHRNEPILYNLFRAVVGMHKGWSISPNDHEFYHEVSILLGNRPDLLDEFNSLFPHHVTLNHQPIHGVTRKLHEQ
ncbi:hypothetical protein MKX03_014624 [Papaver bracteatum]|nr:hypothetical protein MKX03_014624 [Papaver bracteatum]